jgi:hypothetical protein
MSYLRAKAHRVYSPLSAYGYFDVVRLWLKRPATRQELGELARLCAKGDKRPVWSKNKRSRFRNGEYSQVIVARRPSEEALRWITSRPHALVNGVEVALDLTWTSEREADAVYRFFYRHLVRRHHGKTQKVLFCAKTVDPLVEERTAYDAQSYHPNRLALYRTDHDRFTGEIQPIVHLEWRMNGVEALKQAGLPRNLLDFDFRSFWERRLYLVDVDAARLGRFLANRTSGRRRRRPDLRSVGVRQVNLDRRYGQLLLSKYDRLQELFDAYRRERVSRVFYKLDNKEFLPSYEREAVDQPFSGGDRQ